MPANTQLTPVTILNPRAVTKLAPCFVIDDMYSNKTAELYLSQLQTHKYSVKQ